MVVVIVSPVTHKIVNALNTVEDYHFIKSKGPRCFYYTEGKEGDAATIYKTKKLIVQLIGAVYVFEAYGIYNGMIDLFSYLPPEKKDNNKYYNQTKKDISDEELQAWKKENNIV